MAIKLGQLLVSKELITEDQLTQAIDAQKKDGGRIGSNLIKLGVLTEDDLVQFLSQQYGVPSVSLATMEIDSSMIKFIPFDVAHKYQIFPISKNGATLKLAMTDPSNVFAIDDVKFMTGYEVEPVVASESAIQEAITRHYEQADGSQIFADALSGLDEHDMDYIKDAEDDVDIAELKSAVEEAPP